MTHKPGIIFDCDGTLVDSLGRALESFNFALHQLGEPARTPEEIKKYFGAAADRIFHSLLGDEKKALAAFEHYIDHQVQLAHQTRLHEGIGELLETLATHDIPLAIVTGRHARDLELVLKPHGLASFFKVLIADSQLARSKPAPDGILEAARIMGLEPSQTYYVGDSITDIQAAHNAGSMSVAALWDELANRGDLEAVRPTYLAHRPGDVLAIYQQRHS